MTICGLFDGRYEPTSKNNKKGVCVTGSNDLDLIEYGRQSVNLRPSAFKTLGVINNNIMRLFL